MKCGQDISSLICIAEKRTFGSSRQCLSLGLTRLEENLRYLLPQFPSGDVTGLNHCIDLTKKLKLCSFFFFFLGILHYSQAGLRLAESFLGLLSAGLQVQTIIINNTEYQWLSQLPVKALPSWEGCVHACVCVTFSLSSIALQSAAQLTQMRKNP